MRQARNLFDFNDVPPTPLQVPSFAAGLARPPDLPGTTWCESLPLEGRHTSRLAGIRENGACGSPQGLFSQPFTVSSPCVHRCAGDGPYTRIRV